jgi:short subunit dehydrogenase-like uncharacterized protein
MITLSTASLESKHTVGVFGSSGHTGRFVVTELLRRGFTPIAIGRNEARLAASGFPDGGVETRIATVEDPGSLDRALTGVSAVINCAGPFLDTAEPLVAAALRSRVHYLDVTAEQPSALATFERFTEPAHEAGVIVVPAMGFYGGFGDLLATAAMEDWAWADEIRIGIALDRWWPTQGTRLTGERNRARRLMIVGGRLEPLADPAATASWNFPKPFGVQEVIELPFTETVLIGRHLRVSNLHSYLNLTPLQDIRDSSTPPPTPADDTGRSAQTFLMEVIVRQGTEVRRTVARGRDIYAFTGPLVVEAVQRILDGLVQERGVLAPGAIFDAPNFLRALTPQHLTFESGDSSSA